MELEKCASVLGARKVDVLPQIKGHSSRGKKKKVPALGLLAFKNRNILQNSPFPSECHLSLMQWRHLLAASGAAAAWAGKAQPPILSVPQPWVTSLEPAGAASPITVTAAAPGDVSVPTLILD